MWGKPSGLSQAFQPALLAPVRETPGRAPPEGRPPKRVRGLSAKTVSQTCRGKMIMSYLGKVEMSY
jgi:hypothetical protein